MHTEQTEYIFSLGSNKYLKVLLGCRNGREGEVFYRVLHPFTDVIKLTIEMEKNPGVLEIEL